MAIIRHWSKSLLVIQVLTTCMTNNDLDQSVHPRSMTRVLIYPILDSPEDVKGTCEQRRLIRLRGCLIVGLAVRWLIFFFFFFFIFFFFFFFFVNQMYPVIHWSFCEIQCITGCGPVAKRSKLTDQRTNEDEKGCNATGLSQIQKCLVSFCLWKCHMPYTAIKYVAKCLMQVAYIHNCLS